MLSVDDTYRKCHLSTSILTPDSLNDTTQVLLLNETTEIQNEALSLVTPQVLNDTTGYKAN